jgi:flagellar motor switch protein FliN/FliY
MARDEPRTQGDPTAPSDPIEMLLERVCRSRAPSSLDTRSLPELSDLPGKEAVPSRDAEPSESSSVLDKVRLRVRVELGRRKMRVEEAAALTSGDMVDLGRAVDAPVDIFVGDLPIARGEVVVVNGRFSVRVTDVLEARVAGSEEALL